jgi:hypothetical protein
MQRVERSKGIDMCTSRIAPNEMRCVEEVARVPRRITIVKKCDRIAPKTMEIVRVNAATSAGIAWRLQPDAGNKVAVLVSDEDYLVLTTAKILTDYCEGRVYPIVLKTLQIPRILTICA